MILFESTLLLLLVAIVLLQVARRFTIPYPTMLAMAGVGVAALPGAPVIGIDPHLVMALFIAPALLDAGYDMPARALLRHWLPLISLAGVAVLITTAAVAWAGVALAGLPLAAAITLGAIVAPPDAAAAAVMLDQFALPRRMVTVLKGESLLNDATALLIFSAAVAAEMSGTSLASQLPLLSLAVPGGVLLGYLIAKAYLVLYPRLAGTLGGTLFEFVATFGAWIIAERLHVSAILCLVAYAMTIARVIPGLQTPRDRIHSYSVWETVVFLSNVMAFLLMGLQAREIVNRLAPEKLWDALGFAAIVFAIVVVCRILWVLFYNRVWFLVAKLRGGGRTPGFAAGVIVSWCGMRGLVTLATALALPATFPGRDVIVLSALGVVLGTLIVQGLTLGPLIRWLDIPPDGSLAEELSATRATLLNIAIADLGGRDDAVAEQLGEHYRADLALSADGHDPRAKNKRDKIQRKVIEVQRKTLLDLREQGEIEDDVFHTLEQELDWAELAASPSDRLDIVEG